MENFTALLAEKKPTLSPQTVKMYVSGWNGLRKMFERPDDDYSVEFLSNVKEVVEKMRNDPKNYKESSIKFKLALVVVILRLTDEEKHKKAIEDYNLIIDMLSAKLTGKTEEHTKTEKMEGGWITADEGTQILSYLKSNVSAKKSIVTIEQLLNMRNYILYAVQNALGTRNDLAYAKLIFRPPSEKKFKALPEDNNYIMLNKTTKTVSYIMNVYKTAKSTGKNVVEMGGDLYEDLVRYEKALRNFTEEGWMFLNEDGKTRMSANRLGVIYASLAKLAGVDKKLSTTTLRHQKASAHFGKIKEIAEEAKAMSHTLEQHINYMVE